MSESKVGMYGSYLALFCFAGAMILLQLFFDSRVGAALWGLVAWQIFRRNKSALIITVRLLFRLVIVGGIGSLIWLTADPLNVNLNEFVDAEGRSLAVSAGLFWWMRSYFEKSPTAAHIFGARIAGTQASAGAGVATVESPSPEPRRGNILVRVFARAKQVVSRRSRPPQPAFFGNPPATAEDVGDRGGVTHTLTRASPGTDFASREVLQTGTANAARFDDPPSTPAGKGGLPKAAAASKTTRIESGINESKAGMYGSYLALFCFAGAMILLQLFFDLKAGPVLWGLVAWQIYSRNKPALIVTLRLLFWLVVVGGIGSLIWLVLDPLNVKLNQFVDAEGLGLVVSAGLFWWMRSYFEKSPTAADIFGARIAGTQAPAGAGVATVESPSPEPQWGNILVRVFARAKQVVSRRSRPPQPAFFGNPPATAEDVGDRGGVTHTLTRASPGTDFASREVLQTATANAARFDDPPSTPAGKGGLPEAAAASRLPRSEDFGTTWALAKINAFGSGSVLNATVAPDGKTTADFLQESTGNGEHRIRQTRQALAAGSAVTLSVYVKKKERTWIFLRALDDASTGDGGYQYYDLGKGRLGATGSAVGAGTAFAASIQSLPDDWYRCVMSVKPNGTMTQCMGDIFLTTGDAVYSYTGDGISGLYLWGAQIEP